MTMLNARYKLDRWVNARLNFIANALELHLSYINPSRWWTHRHFTTHPHKWDLLSFFLTHWGWETHICVSGLTSIGSDNGLLPGRRQADIWTNAGILLIRPLGSNFSEILIPIQAFSFNAFENVVWKMPAIQSRPQCVKWFFFYVVKKSNCML